MRYSARWLPIVVIAVALLSYSVGKWAAAAPFIPAVNTTPRYDVGDTIELYLDRSKSDNRISVSGRLEAMDGDNFCLSSKESFPLQEINHQIVYGTRDILQWVPRTSVLYVQKTLREDRPATQPK